MTKQKVGLVIFWIGAIWAIAWGALIGFIALSPIFSSLTLEEVNQTIWAVTGPLFMIWGAFGVTLGVIVAGIGILLYAGARGSTVWKFGIGVVLSYLIVIMVLTGLGHYPPLFGVGGTLILLFFLGILWFWAKERKALNGKSTTAIDYKLVGYVFMFIAAWFT